MNKQFLLEVATGRRTGVAAASLRGVLFLLSLVYGALIRCLIAFHTAFRRTAGPRIISIGNITVGGTGKTPLVELVARTCQKQGARVAIVTRGYKRCCRPGCCVPGSPSAAALGDEAAMLRQNLPGVAIVVSADRKRGIRAAVSEHAADTIILDDGFQQWGLKKDLEIVVIDSTNPFGNRHMLPRGILREPLSGLARADLFVLTKTDRVKERGTLEDTLRRYNAAAPVIESIHAPAGLHPLGEPLKAVGGEATAKGPVALFCGIGDPDSFRATAQRRGLRVSAVFPFSDHHCYTPDDVRSLIRQALEKQVTALITTEKDEVKLLSLPREVFSMPVFVLRMSVTLTKNERDLYHRLSSLRSV